MNKLIEAFNAMLVAAIAVIVGSFLLYGSFFFVITLITSVTVFLFTYIVHHIIHVRSLRQKHS
ncbi:hypothetical protein [Shouchella patagoniensis]|uniref:hypothetical protein n=1 Tax=Shouchella patagoniensis TaxID=228576 RepID=UPI001116704C|nr:hypothetical protein [Shouchella patagoniensis]